MRFLTIIAAVFLYAAAAFASIPHGSIGVAGGGAGTIPSLTDLADYQVEQRAPNGTTKVIAFAGTYTGTVPTSVKVQILTAGTSTVIQAYTALSGFTASSGNWSGTLSVPQGAWYNWQAQSYNGVTPLGTSAQTTHHFGVGIIVAMAGQSNMLDWYDRGSSSPPTSDQYVAYYSVGSGWESGATLQATGYGEGALQFANSYRAALGGTIPIGLLPVAYFNSSLIWYSGVTGNNSWLYTTTPGGVIEVNSNANNPSATASPWTLFTQAVTDVGGDVEKILWLQGETDALNVVSQNTYEQGMDVLYQAMLAQTGRTPLTMPIIVGIIGITTSSADGAGWTTIQEALLNWRSTRTGAYAGSANQDIPLADSVHYSTYLHVANRYAQTAAWIDRLTTYPGVGPQISSASINSGGTTVTVNILQTGGTALESTSGAGVGLTGWGFTDNGTPISISATSFTQPSTITLTLASAATTTDTLQLSYMDAYDPNVSNFVYDNTTPGGDTLGAPLLMTATVPVTVQPPPSTSSLASLVASMPAHSWAKLTSANGGNLVSVADTAQPPTLCNFDGYGCMGGAVATSDAQIAANVVANSCTTNCEGAYGTIICRSEGEAICFLASGGHHASSVRNEILKFDLNAAAAHYVSSSGGGTDWSVFVDSPRLFPYNSAILPWSKQNTGCTPSVSNNYVVGYDPFGNERINAMHQFFYLFPIYGTSYFIHSGQAGYYEPCPDSFQSELIDQDGHNPTKTAMDPVTYPAAFGSYADGQISAGFMNLAVCPNNNKMYGWVYSGNAASSYVGVYSNLTHPGEASYAETGSITARAGVGSAGANGQENVMVGALDASADGHCTIVFYYPLSTSGYGLWAVTDVDNNPTEAANYQAATVASPPALQSGVFWGAAWDSTRNYIVYSDGLSKLADLTLNTTLGSSTFVFESNTPTGYLNGSSDIPNCNSNGGNQAWASVTYRPDLDIYIVGCAGSNQPDIWIRKP
ncbi:MAG: hypothetical protein KGJ90_00430 [Patescibacteria group bacterium]|nr:hypothetical protein [Patescibacteria group bacterium]